ncbi:Flp family type IVb pilin [uncultured Caulobacter sp.]|uniref:Flp family type IVb pilin n=1 Tax=uncultured Caulobacter sp. TaxID=158749 RepID=UPI0026229756|nr:Flp family type IVb pilin [uncultured Caulobacter sp.]
MAARRALKAFWADQSGATAVEVGLFVVLISIAIISALNLVSGGIKTAFTKTATTLSGT